MLSLFGTGVGQIGPPLLSNKNISVNIIVWSRTSHLFSQMPRLNHLGNKMYKINIPETLFRFYIRKIWRFRNFLYGSWPIRVRWLAEQPIGGSTDKRVKSQCPAHLYLDWCLFVYFKNISIDQTQFRQVYWNQ